MSTGSEVPIVVEAAALLEKEGIKTRVVSLPCWEVFDAQPEEYRLSVLRSGAPILSVEAYSVSHLIRNELSETDGVWGIDYRMAKVQPRAVWSPCVGCLWPVPEGLRVVRSHRNQCVLSAFKLDILADHLFQTSRASERRPSSSTRSRAARSSLLCSRRSERAS